MSVSNLWRVILIASFSFFISACKPIPSFSVSPDPVIAGQVALFDASATIITDEEAEDEFEDKKDKKIKEEKHKEKHKDKNKPKKTVTYNWTFGDGSTAASGITVTHVFATPGDYSVTLTVKDRDGEVAKLGKVITVKASTTGIAATLQILVQGADGVRVNGAQIKIGAAAPSTATTGTNGVATLSSSSTGTQTVLVSKPGYVSQALSANLVSGATANLNVIMLPVKEVQTIDNIERARLIKAETLGATVLLPASALVDSAGKAVTGTVVVELTPWNINSSDLNSMLGNGKARAADGTLVDLISAGMVTVNFFKVSATGARTHLQLDSANTKTAVIQMDVPYAPGANGLISINGNTMTVGVTIPMWTFNEATGLWNEEGTGTVVPSQTTQGNPSGIAVQARVKHFSTWNWDFKYAGDSNYQTGSVNVKCVDGGTSIACYVSAEISLPDGSKISRSGGYADAISGLTIYRMPSPASYVWTGTSVDGRSGTAVSGAFGNVVIVLNPPKTDNFVQCKLAGVGTECNVTLTATETTANPFTATYYIAADGAPVRTDVDPTKPLVWIGKSRVMLVNNRLVRYEGTVTTDASGNAIIDLTNMIVLPSKTIYVTCDPFADVVPYTGSGSGGTGGTTATYALDSCDISVSVYDYATEATYYSNAVTAPAGTLIPMVVPVVSDSSQVSIYASGIIQVLTGTYYVYGNAPSPDPTRSLQYSDLTNNQSILIRLFANYYGCDGPCLP
jgi:PKD domain